MIFPALDVMRSRSRMYTVVIDSCSEKILWFVTVDCTAMTIRPYRKYVI